MRPRMLGALGLIGVISVISVIVLSACSHSNDRHEGRETPPADLSIVFGEGGGITGRWQGYKIQPDGTLLRWQGHLPEAEPEAAGSLDAEARAALWRVIERLGILRIEASESGELTRIVKITADGDTRELTWVPGRDPEGHGEALTTFYRILGDAVADKDPSETTPAEQGR